MMTHDFLTRISRKFFPVTTNVSKAPVDIGRDIFCFINVEKEKTQKSFRIIIPFLWKGFGEKYINLTHFSRAVLNLGFKGKSTGILGGGRGETEEN